LPCFVEISGESTLGIPRASQKSACTAELDLQWAPASGADHIRRRDGKVGAQGTFHGFPDERGCAGQFAGKRPVEILEHLPIAQFATGNIIQPGLHLRRVADIHDVLKRGHQRITDDHTQIRRGKLAVVFSHVLAILDDADDGGIGGGPPNAVGLELLDEGRLREAGRGLCKVLFRNELH